jgi:hypothetical protein
MIILVLLGIGFAGFYLFYNVSPPAEEDAVSLYRTPILKTVVTGGDGQNHSINARFGLEITTELEDTVDVEAAVNIIERGLASLDYDTINEERLDYVKAHLMEELEGKTGINADAIEAIYVTDFVTDFELTTDTLPDISPVNDIFRGLFQNAD